MNKIPSLCQRLQQRFTVVLMAMTLFVAGLPYQQVLATESAPNLDQTVTKQPASITESRSSSARNRSSEPTKPAEIPVALSDNPSDQEIMNTGFFLQPLAPMTDKCDLGENRDLAKAMLSFVRKNNREDVSDITTFLERHPNSRWNASLEANIARTRLNAGYLSDALRLWNSAWEKAKTHTEQRQQAVADYTISNLVVLESRLGLVKDLEKHLTETSKRPFVGSAEKLVRDSRGALWAMQKHPETGFRCGPFSVNILSNLIDPGNKRAQEMVARAVSTSHGTSLAQVNDWADQVGLEMQMAKRTPGSKVLFPAVIHWKVCHFASIVGEDHGRYVVRDPSFGGENFRMLSTDAIDLETDGYFLVPKGKLPVGWRPVGRKEGMSVWGKGYNPGSRSDCKTGPIQCLDPCCEEKSSSESSGGSPMAKAGAFSLDAGLTIVDYPISYRAPFGPDMTVECKYNFGEMQQPSGSWNFTNLGLGWCLNWASYLQDDTSTTPHTTYVSLRGGGYEKYSDTAYSTPDPTSQAKMSLITGGYARNLPDGTVENYTQPCGVYYLLTSVVDPQGKAATVNWTYVSASGGYKISSVTDAAGRSTSYSYNTGLNDYLPSSITDPFGRSASFTYSYDSGTQTYRVASITDPAGNYSRFSYTAGSSFINQLTTPYGTTQFQNYVPSGQTGTLPLGLRVLFPDKTTAVMETYLGYCATTFYWDRLAMSNKSFQSDPQNRNYSHCKTTCWTSYNGVTQPAPMWVRSPCESPVFYSYLDQQDPVHSSPKCHKPIQVARALTATTRQATITTTTGTVGANDVLKITLSDNLLPNDRGSGSLYVTYAVPSSSTTLTDIAAGIAKKINDDWRCQTFGFSASSNSNVLQISSYSIDSVPTSAYLGQWTWHGTAREQISSFTPLPNDVQTSTVTGSPSAGDQITIQVLNSDLPGGVENVVYTVQSSDTTLGAVLQGIAKKINLDQALQGVGINAYWTARPFHALMSQPYPDPQLIFKSNDTNIATTYTITKSGGATESFGIASVADWGVVQTSYFYRSVNPLYKVTQAIDGLGRQFDYTYTSDNIDLQKVQETQNGDAYVIASFVYDSNHRPTYLYDGSGQQTRCSYNSNEQLQTVTDPLGGTTTFAYDQNWFVTSIQGPLGTSDVANFSWNSSGTLSSVTDSEEYTLSYSYDVLDRLITVTYPDNTSEQTIYNYLDPVLQCDRLGRWTLARYDSMDQLVSVTDPLGRTINYGWCGCGALASVTDANGNTTSWIRDLEGRVTTKQFADGSTETFTYEHGPSGQWPLQGTNRLLSQTDAKGQTKSYLYNLDDSLCSTIYSVAGTSQVTITYDPKFSRVSSIANGWGTYNYSYNAYYVSGSAITGGGRVTSVSNPIPSSTISYQYDALGRTTNRSIGASNSVTWNYDAISRITYEVNPLGTGTPTSRFNYTYVDDTGNSKGCPRLSSITYPYTSPNTPQTTNFSWLPNVCDQRLEQIANLSPSSTTLSQFNYAYDAVGEIAQWKQQNSTAHPHLSLGYDLAGQLISATSDSGSSFQAFVSGTPKQGDNVTVTAYDATLANGFETATYVVQASDNTPAAVASGLVAQINSVMSNIGVTAQSNGTQIVTISASPNCATPDYCTQFTCAVTGSGATDTIALSGSSPIASLDQQLYYNYDSAGNRAAVQGNSSGSFSNGNFSTVVTNYTCKCSNFVNELTNVSAGGAVRFQGTTTEPINSALVNVSQMVTVSGTTLTQGDQLSLSVTDAGLSGAETVSYPVGASDSTQHIASQLASLVNTDSRLASIGVTATYGSGNSFFMISSSSVNLTSYGVLANGSNGKNATETITLSGLSAAATITPGNTFTANPALSGSSGGDVTSTASVAVVGGNGQPAKQSYTIKVPQSNPSPYSFTYDLNSNMTTDGTTGYSYSWDAENRLTQITYSGIGNNTQFTYDPLGRCVKIVENGTVSNTMQFVWDGTGIFEQRDVNGNLTNGKQFFGLGQINFSSGTGTNYFYRKDQLGSVREMTDSSGNIVAQYGYDPYGKVTPIGTPSVNSDFQYAGMYLHARSGLNLTLFRQYNSQLGRWLSRDPIGEAGGTNLYGYVGNNPISFVDPLGLQDVEYGFNPVLMPSTDPWQGGRAYMRSVDKNFISPDWLPNTAYAPVNVGVVSGHSQPGSPFFTSSPMSGIINYGQMAPFIKPLTLVKGCESGKSLGPQNPSLAQKVAKHFGVWTIGYKGDIGVMAPLGASSPAALFDPSGRYVMDIDTNSQIDWDFARAAAGYPINKL